MTNIAEPQRPDQDLLFRRQYIIGPRFVEKFPTWRKVRINAKLFLTIHPDIEFCAQKNKDTALYLLGFALDPFHPEYGNDRILRALLRTGGSFADILTNTADYGGRFVIICARTDGVKIFHDPAGLRQIFYYKNNDRVWAASQPHILAQELNVREDSDKKISDFLASEAFRSGKTEHAWIGEGTLFEGIRHLLPNHYLDLRTGCSKRYWPAERLQRLSCDKAVVEPAQILQGLLKSGGNRYKLALAVTAGWDSRVLLAASRPIKEKVHYFILKYPRMNDDHNDIRVPARLLDRLGLKFNVIKVGERIDERFLDIFKKNVPFNQCDRKIGGRYAYFKDLSGFIKVGGAASEIARSSLRVNTVSAQTLAMLLGYRRNAFAIECMSKWLESAKALCDCHNVNIFDLFYWEQRMGNWGAANMSESDIAIEEFHPFNCRRLLVNLLSVDKKDRDHRYSVLYRMLIERLWPDVLSEPINPASFRSKTKTSIRMFLRRMKECPLFISAKR